MLLFLTVACGCSVEPETLDSLRAAVNTISKEGVPQAEVDSSQLGEPSTVQASFDAPHPNRVDAFSFAEGIENDDTGNPKDSVANVVVVGFANVREPRVFLKVDEQTRSLRVGDLANGIEVVAIREPVVELRMGSLIWTATMFDKANGTR